MVFIFNHNLNILCLSSNVKKFKTTAKFYLKQQKQGTSYRFQGCLLSRLCLYCSHFKQYQGSYIFVYNKNVSSQCSLTVHIEWVQNKYGVMLLHCYELLSCVYSGINETESHQWDKDLNVTKFKAHPTSSKLLTTLLTDRKDWFTC